MTATKLDTLVHYVCAKCDNPNQLDATKLNKVLWCSDVFAYSQSGESITGSTYIKRQFGPVPKDIMAARSRLQRDGLIIERQAMHHDHQQTQFIALKAPDITMFSSEQISLVDRVLQAICTSHTDTPVPNIACDLVWEAADIGEEIPMSAAAYAGNIGEIDESDMTWAKGEIDSIERARVPT